MWMTWFYEYDLANKATYVSQCAFLQMTFALDAAVTNALKHGIGLVEIRLIPSSRR